MTKHFLPEPLFGTDYIRSDDGAIMREDEQGCFVRKIGTTAPNLIEPPHVKPLKKFKRRNRSISATARNNIKGGITSAFRERADVGFDQCAHFRFRNFVIPSAVNRFRCTIAWTPRSQFRYHLPVRLHEERSHSNGVSRRTYGQRRVCSAG
jgi:hypothetical protein